VVAVVQFCGSSADEEVACAARAAAEVTADAAMYFSSLDDSPMFRKQVRGRARAPGSCFPRYVRVARSSAS
jgi:hypothetical protein